MFELACPMALLFIVLPPLIWFLVPKAPLSMPLALRVPFYSAVARLVDGEKRLANPKRTGLFFIIWALLILALSGPRWVGAPVPLTREASNIMLVLDLSGSMELEDMISHNRFVTRLSVVKAAAKQFVAARAGDRIGLILFGTQAYLQTPLTFDTHNVLARIDDATVGLAGKSTAIGDALGLAVKRLQSVPETSRVIILLTDGASNAGVLPPLTAAELAKGDGIKVYTIGLGAEVDPRAQVDDLFQISAGSDLDEKTLQDIARMTGARYFRTTDPDSLRAIYQTIHELEAVSQDDVTVRPLKDYYIWPLAAAILLLLAWFADKAGLRSSARLNGVRS